MGNSRNTGYLQNAVKVADNGDISLMHGSTMLMQISSSGAITTTGVISGSNALSASYAATASFVTLAQTASFVTTAQTASFVTTAQTASFVANAQSASNAITAQTASFANTFTVASTLTAQTLVVQTITSSIVYSSGSNIFGNNIANTQTFTGSVLVTGSIGIGTSPKSYSTLTSNGQIIGLNNIGIDAGQSFRLNNYYNSGTTTDRTISTGYAASLGLNNAQGAIVFNISSATASADNNITTTERVRITSTGNVGIGTTNPNYKLHITGSNSMLKLESSGATFGSPSVNLLQGAIDTILTATNNGLEIGTWSSHPIIFRVSSTGGTEAMRITNAGNVGIGTSTVWNKVTIRTAANNNLDIYDNTNGVGLQAISDSAAAYRTMRFDSSTFAFMNGNVGIGTTSTNYKLQVDGRINCGTIVQGNFIAGQICGNLNSALSPNFLLLFDMTNNAAGWSLAGTVNAAAWDAWNISTIWIQRMYSSFTVTAGITGLYKSGVDFAICDVTYNSTRYIALRFTSNPEIDVMWTGYGLHSLFNSNGTITPVNTGVTVNSTKASY